MVEKEAALTTEDKVLFRFQTAFRFLHVGREIVDGFLHSISQNHHLTVAAPLRFTSRAGRGLLVRSSS